jgi:hypothetical protein
MAGASSASGGAVKAKRKIPAETLQQFGTIETAEGLADAMLCIDADRQSEFMVHLWGQGIRQMALLLTASERPDGSIELRPECMYWAAADSMDTDLSSMSLLELYRADIADS